MWNQRRYEEGYMDADFTIGESGLAAAKLAHARLESSKAVDEFEVGFRTRIELEDERKAQ